MNNRKWWKDVVVYQIYPKSFQDSDGDGMGDIRGIIERLDYLKDLGIQVLWLCPVYRSPMDDNGYDISDYYHIDPRFGTDDDMEELIKKAREAGIKLLMDLVVNHTSDEHEWFQKALEDPNSKYADYYIFKEGRGEIPPNNWRSYFGGSAWERVGDTNRYYLHAFGKKQPDLNWENKELREEIYKMVNYWLDKGIGGFRIDAISNLKKNFQFGILPADGTDGLCSIGDYILNQPGIETYLTELNERTFQPHNSMTVAEANVPDHLLGQFIGENGFFSMVFDFSYTDMDVLDGIWFQPSGWSVKMLRENIFHSQIETQKKGWGAVYLENHDQPRSLNKYLPEQEINYYSTTMLAALFMLLRGTPYIYQGQEIGMTNIHMETMKDYDDIATHAQYKSAIEAGLSPEKAFAFMYQRSRDNSRAPMQWSGEKNAGFSQADHTWLKVNPNYKQINVEMQKDSACSVWSFYKELIALRTKSEYQDILTDGEFVPYEMEDESVIAYERRYNRRKLLIVTNFQNKDTKIQLGDEWEAVVLGNYRERKAQDGWYFCKPYETVVWKNISHL